MMNSIFARRNVAAVILLTAVFLLCAPCVSWGDALVESYWDLAYVVDYDVYVNAPDGGVNLRNGAGTEYAIMLSSLIPNGTRLHVTYEAKASNGKKWGQVNYQGQTGWVFLGQCSKTPPAVKNSESNVNSQAKPEQNKSNADKSAPVSNSNVSASSPNNAADNQPSANEYTDDKDKIDDSSQETEKDTSQAPAETEKTADHYTPLMLVIVALLIVIAVLLAVLILRSRKNKN
ncbi:MAG: SH3 domain-containing protein [Firmicutes bacterium]|nr:SH3 domain-containing protein [Bacillota bacterium]